MPIIETQLLDRPWPWDKIVTPQRPRKCVKNLTTGAGCGTVYPFDHPNAPDADGVCKACREREAV